MTAGRHLYDSDAWLAALKGELGERGWEEVAFIISWLLWPRRHQAAAGAHYQHRHNAQL